MTSANMEKKNWDCALMTAANFLFAETIIDEYWLEEFLTNAYTFSIVGTYRISYKLV